MGAIADVKKKLGIEEKDDAKAVDAILAKIDELTKLAESGKVSGDQATKLQKELDEIKKKLAEKDKGGDKSETEKKAAELESKLTEVVASNKTLAEKLTVMERDKCITKALSEGRMLPEKRKFYEDLYMESPALVGKAIDAMPVVIELKAKGNPNDRQPDDITDEERALHRRLGHTDEDIKKYRE
jgi:phage I-like protein